MFVSVDQIVTRCFNLERVSKEVVKVGKAPPELMKLHVHTHMVTTYVLSRECRIYIYELKEEYRETLFGSRMILDLYFVFHVFVFFLQKFKDPGLAVLSH